MFTYTVHGLTLSSDIEFPELVPSSGTAHVRVRRGPVPEHLEAPSATGVLFETSPEHYLLRVDQTARYWARRGREVVIEAVPDAPEPYVRLLFLGSVLTAVLHQRGTLVMHAAGALGPQGAVLIAGHSGYGKSTLLAALADRGWLILADDAVAVTLDVSGRPIVQPGFAEIRLWNDAATRLGHSLTCMARPHPGIDKYALSLTSRLCRVAQPLSAIFVLGMHNADHVAVDTIADVERFHTVREFTRNLGVLKGLGMQVPHFHMAAAVASQVPLFRLTRPMGRNSLAELIEHVESSLT